MGKCSFKIQNQWNTKFKLTLLTVFSEDAKHTASFIDHMDKLFNSFNSRSSSSKAQMNHAISETSGHKLFLEETLAWLRTIKHKGLYSLMFP